MLCAQREEVFDLLAKNYVEDDDNVFRFRYSPDFLTWCVQSVPRCNATHSRCVRPAVAS